jgi:hypothetical protein
MINVGAKVANLPQLSNRKIALNNQLWQDFLARTYAGKL